MSLAEDLDAEKGIAKLHKPQAYQAQHLKLYVKVVINGRPISRAFINNGVLLNVSLFSTIKKLGKSK